MLKCTDDKPKLQQLQELKGVRKLVRIIDEIAYKWDDVAIALGFDWPAIERIRRDTFYQTQKATVKMFTEWLDDNNDLRNPVSWSTLIECLREAELAETAQLLESGNVAFRRIANLFSLR